MLKRGDIIRSTRTGRLQEVKRVDTASWDKNAFVVTTRKIRKDGVSWGWEEFHAVTAAKPIPFRYELVARPSTWGARSSK